MSQLSSQVQDPNWVSVPVAKFSHNNSPYGTKSFIWIHINHRNDLDFVIRNARVVDDYGNFQDRILMKVTGGAEVLETQDLGQLVSLCRDFDPATGAEYPVDIVVKSPFMAMRYPKTGNTVRRIQLKFRSDQDFKRTMTIMEDLGLRITCKDSAVPAVAPSISPAPSLASSATATSGTSHTLADPWRRPASSLTMSTSSVSGGSRLMTSSPMKPEFKVPLQPNSAFSDDLVPAGRIPYPTPHITIPFSTTPSTSRLVPFSPRSRIESLHQLPAQNNSLCVSQMEKESQNQRMSQPILPPLSSGNSSSPASASLYISQMQLQRDEFSECVEATSKLLSASPHFPSTSNVETSAAEISHSSDFQRPSSTLTEHSDIMKMWIPPKRELPFPKPRKASKALSSSVPEVPPTSPKPTSMTRTESIPRATEASGDAASTPVKKPAPKKRIAQRKAPNAKLTGQQPPIKDLPATEMTEESIPKLASIREELEELSPLAAKSAAAATSLRPASAPGFISKAILPPKKRAAPPPRPTSTSKRPKMVDRGTQTLALSGRDHSSAEKLLPTGPPPDLVADTPSPGSPPGSYLNDLDAFITKHNPQPKAKELWESPGYAEADEEHRQTMLNDFICENLDNADFLQLCRDAEFAWRRIGLGM